MRGEFLLPGCGTVSLTLTAIAGRSVLHMFHGGDGEVSRAASATRCGRQFYGIDLISQQRHSPMPMSRTGDRAYFVNGSDGVVLVVFISMRRRSLRQ